MTTEQKIIKTKVGILELAKQLGNVSQACKIMGYSESPSARTEGTPRNLEEPRGTPAAGAAGAEALTVSSPSLRSRNHPRPPARLLSARFHISSLPGTN
jgi:hypothetical protein